MAIITEQEIEWLARIENVLDLPKGKLVKAFINNRMLMVSDALEALVYPANRSNSTGSKKQTARLKPEA